MYNTHTVSRALSLTHTYTTGKEGLEQAVCKGLRRGSLRAQRKQLSASSARRSNSPTRTSLQRKGKTPSAGPEGLPAARDMVDKDKAVSPRKEVPLRKEVSPRRQESSSSADTLASRRSLDISRDMSAKVRGEKLSSEFFLPTSPPTGHFDGLPHTLQTQQTPQTPVLGISDAGGGDCQGVWNEVEGVVALFELCKASDLILLAWAAGALRACFNIMCNENSAEGQYRKWHKFSNVFYTLTCV